MHLLDIIPATKNPRLPQQIFSYFSSQKLPLGALTRIPLGKHQEIGVIFGARAVSDYKMEIKSADFKLRNIGKVVSAEPVLTERQIKLALWLGEYYFTSPGLFVKMLLPKGKNYKLKITNYKKNPKSKNQKLILAPTIAQAKKIAGKEKKAILWHSGLGAKQQNEIWQQVKTGRAKTIVGTRSAVFLPFANLKKIVIAEAANAGHKSWDTFPRWRTNEAAQKLSELFNARFEIKNSAIPSVEFPFSARQPMVNGAQPALVDMRAELKDGCSSIFSRPLQQAIKNILLPSKKTQAVFFINRRGAANLVLCRDCGFIELCPNCEAPLSYHFSQGKPLLLCHRCGARKLPPSLCPACRSWRIKTFGSGTQQAEMELKKLFPSLPVSRLDSDLAPDSKKQIGVIKEFTDQKSQVLIGTQMVLNHELPPVDLSAALAIDTLLHLPDFHSGERTWQTIAALKNLARPNSPVFIQTYNPENQLLKWAAQDDWQSFYQDEMETRRQLDFPPFAQIAKLVFRHRQAKIAAQEAKFLAAKLHQANRGQKAEISEALPAFVPKEKGKFIWQIIIKFSLKHQLKTKSDFLTERNSLFQYVPTNWEIDIDPENLL
ncbi:MAG: primosomal protein N' [Candidatus Portnoybacteria bacterium]|nr:primosomal protein N' [Candidatus Portnoybacteria bacterium]